MLRRYLVCGLIGVGLVAAPSSATLDTINLPVFKRLSHPMPGIRPEAVPQRGRIDMLVNAQIDDLIPSKPFQKSEMPGIATLTAIGTKTGLHLSAGAVRNTSQIEHQIDAAISQLRLDPKANALGQNRTAFIGVGYGVGEIEGPGLRMELAAGARLQDRSYRGRLNYSGETWRGALDQRFDVEPSLNVGVSYRF